MLPLSYTISLEYCNVYIPQPGKTDVVITIAAFPVENLQLQGDKDHPHASALPYWKYSLSTYKIYKGFVIVCNYSDENCKKDKSELYL